MMTIFRKYLLMPAIRWLGRFAALALLIAGLHSSGAQAQEAGAVPKASPRVGSCLLYYSANVDGGYTDRITPSTFRRDPGRLEYINTLPFDGVAIASDVGWELMQERGKKFDLESIRRQFSPISGLQLGRLKHNFAIVNASKPGDFFDDDAWTIIVKNFAHLSIALRESGIEGIFFDNEVYKPAVPLFNWNVDCDFKSKSLSEYRDQARKRGREIMQAMIKEYPDIVVIFAHGPYVSAPLSVLESTVNAPFSPRQSRPEYCELMGPFTVGFMEGKGDRAVIVDGGEEYKFRTQEHYRKSYTARKTYMGSEAFNCPFVPKGLRGEEWATRLSIAFGVFAGDWPEARLSSTPASVQQCLTHALMTADRYVWLYTQTRDRRFMTPQGVPSEWIQAVRNARKAAQDR